MARPDGRSFGEFTLNIPSSPEEREREALRQRRASLCLVEVGTRLGASNEEIKRALDLVGLLPEEENA